MKPLLLLIFCCFSLFSLPSYAAIPLENIKTAAPILPIKTKKNSQKATTKTNKKKFNNFFTPPKKHKQNYGGKSNIGLWLFVVTMSATGGLGYFFVQLLTIGVGLLMPLAVILGMMLCTWMSYLLLRRSKFFQRGNKYLVLLVFLFVGIWGLSLYLGGIAAGIAWLRTIGYILWSLFLMVLYVFI